MQLDAIKVVLLLWSVANTNITCCQNHHDCRNVSLHYNFHEKLAMTGDQTVLPSAPTLFHSLSLHHGPVHPNFTMPQAQSASASTSSSNFQSIFNAALNVYDKKTKNDLLAHPLDEQHRCMGWNSHGVSKVSVIDAAGVKQVEHKWLNVWDSRWENW